MFFSNTNRIKRILQVRGTCFPKDNICMQDYNISQGKLWQDFSLFIYLPKRNNMALKWKYWLLNCFLRPIFHRFFFPYVPIFQFL